MKSAQNGIGWSNPRNQRVNAKLMAISYAVLHTLDVEPLIDAFTASLRAYDLSNDYTKVELDLEVEVKRLFPAHGKNLADLLRVKAAPRAARAAPQTQRVTQRRNRPWQGQYQQQAQMAPQQAPQPAQVQAQGNPLLQASMSVCHVGDRNPVCGFCTRAGSAQPSHCYFLKKNPTAQTVIQ
jgi:hypothetical protein